MLFHVIEAEILNHVVVRMDEAKWISLRNLPTYIRIAQFELGLDDECAPIPCL